MAQWLSWLERRPVTAEVVGSSPIWVVTITNVVVPLNDGVLAQLGEHLPYKQRVIGSSPIGPIFLPFFVIFGVVKRDIRRFCYEKCLVGRRFHSCRI